MSTTPEDWRFFFEFADVWRTLSAASRKQIVGPDLPEGSPRTSLNLSGLKNADIEKLRSAGFINARRHEGKGKLCPAAARFLDLIGVLLKFDVFTGNSDYQIWHNLRLRISPSTLQSLAARPYRPEIVLAATVQSYDWVEDFLEAESLKEWLRRRRISDPMAPYDPRTFGDAKTVLESLLSADGPVPLHELPGRTSLDGMRLADAAALGVQMLVLFPAVSDDLLPALGLLPQPANDLRRLRNGRPGVVSPQETFECPFLLEDMSALLAAACREPIRLRKNDHQLYATDARAIAEQMAELPSWLFGGHGRSQFVRLELAKSRLLQLNLLTLPPRRSRDLYLAASPEAGKWLARSRKERLRQMLDDVGLKGEGKLRSLLPPEFAASREVRQELLAFLRDSLAMLPSEGECFLLDFIHSSTLGASALRKIYKSRKEHERAWSYQPITLRRFEQSVADAMCNLVFADMLPLGAVRIGVAPSEGCLHPAPHDGRLHVDSLDDEAACSHDDGMTWTISLTSAGRYLMGMADDFDEVGAVADSRIIVQPNYEIVFLARLPTAEAMIARYAERVGQGMGVLFKLTKSAVMTAAARGAQVDQVIGELNGLAAKGLPPNVEREIRGWFQQCRRVSSRQCTLVECPDAATAARLRSVGGKSLNLITDTLVEIPAERPSAELLKKLAKAGIFVE